MSEWKKSILFKLNEISQKIHAKNVFLIINNLISKPNSNKIFERLDQKYRSPHCKLES